MSYDRNRTFALVVSAFRGAMRPSYLRAIARASLDWNFISANHHLKSVSISSLCQEPLDIGFRVAPGTWGETAPVDLLALCTLVRACRPKRSFGFGTFTGNATLHIAMNSPSDAEVITIDLLPSERNRIGELEWESSIDDRIIGNVYRTSTKASQITQLLGDSRSLDTAPYRNNINFVWIDACHEYSFVKNDSEKAFEMLAPGGTVAWHDHSRACPDVSRYLRELSKVQQVQWIAGTQNAYVVR